MLTPAGIALHGRHRLVQQRQVELREVDEMDAASAQATRSVIGRSTAPVHAGAAVFAARTGPAVGTVEAVDDDSCVLATGADSVEMVAVCLGLLDADFEVTDPPELVAKLWELADRYRRAVRSGHAGGWIRR